MKVKELIEKLKEFDGEKRIMILDGNYFEITHVEEAICNNEDIISL